jgi:hypothetical protein
MNLDNSKRVIRVASIYPAFRSAFRANPQQALSLFAKDLDLQNEDSLEPKEIDAILSITDEEYMIFSRIALALGDSLEKGESPMSCFYL